MQPILISLLATCLYGLAPLEKPDGSPIYFGTWFDRPHGDTAVATNARLNYKPLSLFQSDVNITETLQAADTDDIFAKIKETGTDAIVYLTVYPMEGYGNVSDGALADLSGRIAAQTALGTKIFIRYASEMNGQWFPYGQQPTNFIAAWKRFVSAVRTAVKDNLANVAFIWAPNSGNGYPFPDGQYSALPNTAHWDPALDTNGDGKYTNDDDPYTPFYPDIPALGKVEQIITGTNGYGPFNFYSMFCGKGSAKSAGGKPFIMTETAATIHMAVRQTDGSWKAPVNSDASMRAQIKQAWWRQMLNQTFLTTYSKVKAISFFEFIKFEENSWRDFTSLGGDVDLVSPLGNDGTSMDDLTLTAFQSDLKTGLDQLIAWASAVAPAPVPTAIPVKQVMSSAHQMYNVGATVLVVVVACAVFKH
ncbi:hypothetical protein HDV03_001971 [Kappamyces sp. JEL0829]|nr:hypothetical protein HDV03_001971 [Kappamyces sp. JEL0829]